MFKVSSVPMPFKIFQACSSIFKRCSIRFVENDMLVAVRALHFNAGRPTQLDSQRLSSRVEPSGGLGIKT